MNRVIPPEVTFIIGALEAQGYEAYAVGGCVRDVLLGKKPKDWDLCTSALPEQTRQCFAQYPVIETGLKHGTVTLMLNHQSYEITTFRVDGPYHDNRRPSSVAFAADLKEDLSRRDFSLNAMAYNPRHGLVDLFNGKSDIENRVIRAVGKADRRFEEDALRIMRALRFAAVLGFSIESQTSSALHRSRELLGSIAVERITRELDALLCGSNVESVLLEYADVLFVVIPELRDMVGFQQNNPHHVLDVWEHTVRSVSEAPVSLAIRLTMLLHDIAKPSCYSEAHSVGHFYGHPELSTTMAQQILTRLRYSNNTREAVVQLISYHDTNIHPSQQSLKRWLGKIGEERLRQLIEVKRADTKAQSELSQRKRLETLSSMPALIDEIIEQQQCFALKDLAIDGRDLLALGIPEGRRIGTMLNQLLDMVIEELVTNEREPLLEAAQHLQGLRNQ